MATQRVAIISRADSDTELIEQELVDQYHLSRSEVLPYHKGSWLKRFSRTTEIPWYRFISRYRLKRRFLWPTTT